MPCLRLSSTDEEAHERVPSPVNRSRYLRNTAPDGLAPAFTRAVYQIASLSNLGSGEAALQGGGYGLRPDPCMGQGTEKWGLYPCGIRMRGQIRPVLRHSLQESRPSAERHGARSPGGREERCRRGEICELSVGEGPPAAGIGSPGLPASSGEQTPSGEQFSQKGIIFNLYWTVSRSSRGQPLRNCPDRVNGQGSGTRVSNGGDPMRLALNVLV